MRGGAPPGRRIVRVGWDEIDRQSRALAALLRTRGRWRGIVAIARGGLVPAAILARELDLRLVDTVCIASYDEMEKGEPVVMKSLSGPGAGLLLVDDLVDTGATARLVRAMLPLAHYAVLYAKPQGRPYVDSFVQEIGQDVWIVFPWETDPRGAEPP